MADDQDDGIPEDVCIIIDNGTGTCKAGLSSDDVPKVCFPDVIGRPRRSHKDTLPKDTYIGNEVKEHLGKLALSNALENGIIESFEDMELIWDHAFDLLQVNPSLHSVVITEPPFNPKPNRERVVEVMFETFEVPSLNISVQGVLALLGQGRTSGLVLDSGAGVTHTIPIFEGYGMTSSIIRIDLAGRDLNTLLAKLLAMENICLTTTWQQHHVQIMKETVCYVTQDSTSEEAAPVTYKMPDGQQIVLKDERWKCPEALFNPSAVCGLEEPGVAEIVWRTIEKCERDTRKQLLSNIVLSGGSTCFPGFHERLTKEIKSMAPTATQAMTKIVAARDRQNAVWNGGKVFSDLRSMQEDMWMTFEDYDEYGAQIVHDKMAIKYA
eukprot:NODE_7344_length_1588_cov_3.605065.p1 GENE.NODE_7344_length_1588_cov_3.605065~~NODE_7344_length_1588_cov_3.605065.p1  ORF type:complete len:381 (-),score=129.13 NODE_7344_length_1588_cov_3.605065:336-1478(-)